MYGSKSLATPYHLLASLKLCQCTGPEEMLGRYKRLDRAEANGNGYWALYVGFFGSQRYLITFSIVDTRDGIVLWRNGRRTVEGMQHGDGKP